MPSPAHAASRWNAAVATFVYVDMFELGSGQTVEFVTENQSTGADPVLHLFRVLPDGSYQQVAVADDMQWPVNPNASISYYNSGAAGSFVLLLRAYSTAAAGVCDVRMGPVLRQAAAPVGGWLAPSSAFEFAAGNQLRSVHIPGGSEFELLLGLQDAYVPTSMAIGNSIAGSAEFAVAGSETYFLFGTPHIRRGPNDYSTFRGGFFRAAFNDLTDALGNPTDADGDGVGDGLELAIGTCGTVDSCCGPGAPAQTCAQGYGGRDSDRDGLSDGEELFGVAGILPSGADELDLARWGANPQRKDVFVEVDHSTLFGSGQVPENTSPFQWMRDNPSPASLSGYAGIENFADTGRLPFLAGPASHVRNRDGSGGIALHMDLGVQPLSPADEEKFGAYSTGSPRALVPDLQLRITGPIPAPGLVSLTINGTTWGFDATGMTAEEIGATIALSTLFVPEFNAAVHYVGPMTVANPQDVTVRLASNTPGVHFTRGVAPMANLTMLPMLEEEARNHALEPSQFDAVRRGRFHYGVAMSEFGGGQSTIAQARFASGLGKLEFFHELGHAIGLEHWGHDAWGQNGVECMPHYRSLMNYDKKTYAFTTRDDPLQINPGAISEIGTFGPSWTGGYSFFLEDPYYYTPPTGSAGVDWNRDGGLGAGLWRAAALTAAGKSCQAYSQGQTIIDPEPAITGPVDLVRFGSNLYAMWSDGTNLRAQSAPLGTAGSKSCTGSAGNIPGTCLSWSGTFTLASLTEGLRGVTALSHNGSLFVATATSFGTLTVYRYIPGALLPLTLVSTQQYLPDAAGMRALGTPELVVRHTLATGPTLILLYHGRDHTYRSFAWNGSTWTDEGALIDDATGLAIAAPVGGDGPAAKSWPDTTLQPAWAANEYRTLAVLPAANTAAQLYLHTGVGNRWGDVVSGFAAPSVVGKPFLEFRPVRSDSGLPDALFSGHFMVGWQRSCGTGTNCPWVETTALVSRSDPPAVANMNALPERDWLQNTWAIVQPGSSAALFSEATLDNVFGLFPSGVGPYLGVTFYPHADGAPLQTYSTYSDFRLMEDYVCLSVGGQQNPGNSCGVTASSPLNVFN